MEKQTIDENQSDSDGKKYTLDKNNCPVTNALKILSGKYKLQIIEAITENCIERFGELRRKLDNVAQATLTAQLRELERDGVITRTAYAESPPRVEYTLTELGHSLIPVITVLKNWNEKYCKARPASLS